MRISLRTWSLPLGSIFDVEIRLHLTYLFLLVFVWLTEPNITGQSMARGLGLVGIVLASVILHEIAHTIVAVHEGRTPRSILLLPLGGIATTQKEDDDPEDTGRHVRIALAGPMANLLIAAVAGTIFVTFAPAGALRNAPLIHPDNLLRSLVWINFFLGAINLLPAYPLDGGHILRAVFARTMDPYLATRRAVTIGQTFAMLLILGGIFNSWAMLAGFFLFVATQLEDRSTIFQSLMHQVSMGDVMLTDFCTLSPADTLEDALDKAVHTLQDDFPVVRGSDMVGVVTRQRIVQALRHGNGYVQSVMVRGFPTATREETLAVALGKIKGGGLTLIPVVDQERLVGIVTLQNLMHSMRLLAESRRFKSAGD